MNDTPLRRLLERVADLTLVGLLTIVAGLGVVTGLAGVRAAARTLTRDEGEALLPTYRTAFAAHLRGTIRPQLIMVVAAVIGVVDLAVGLRWLADRSGGWLPAPVLACGVLLVAAGLVLPPYLAVLPLLDDRGPVRLRTAVVAAAGTPVTSALIMLVGVTLGVVAVALPVLIPVLVGLHVRCCVLLLTRTRPAPAW